MLEGLYLYNYLAKYDLAWAITDWQDVVRAEQDLKKGKTLVVGDTCFNNGQPTTLKMVGNKIRRCNQ